MTAATSSPTAPPRCPSCEAETTVGLSDGTVLCLACRHEWDPARPAVAPVPAPVTATPVVPAVELGPAAHVTHVNVRVQDVDTLHVEIMRTVVMTADQQTRAEAESMARANVQEDYAREHPGVAFQVLDAEVDWSSQPFTDDGAGDVPDPPQAAVSSPEGDAGTADPLAWLIGHEVVLGSGMRAIVREFVDDDNVLVETARGRKRTVAIADLVRDVTLDTQREWETIDLSDHDALALAGTYALGAALTIEAGCAMVDGTGPAATVGVAPTGWLPFETDEAALVEQMAACAVAALVRAFDLPRDDVAMIAATLRNQAQQGDTETEEQ